MSTEFSIEGFTDYCRLTWSKPRLARNLNWYRKAEPTKEFWELYNGKQPGDKTKMKKFLKDNGITVFKEFGEFGVFDWNFDEKGTEQEYRNQQKKRDKEVREALYPLLIEQIEKGSEKEYKLDKRELDRCKSLEQMEEYARSEIISGVSICDKVEYDYSLI